MLRFRCRKDAEEVQRCRGAEVQRYRCVEVQSCRGVEAESAEGVQIDVLRCRVAEEMQRRCRGDAEAHVQRCRGACAEVQMC